MVITATTTYNLDSLKVFQQVAARHVNPKYYAGLRIFYLLAGVAGLGIGVYYTLAVFGGDHDIVTIALAGLGIYMGIQMLIMGVQYYDYFAKRAMASIPEGGHKNYYSFEKDQIVLSNQARSGSYSYTQFGYVYETKNYFLFYINVKNGYVLEKAGIENATSDQLRQLLDSKCTYPVIQLNDI